MLTMPYYFLRQLLSSQTWLPHCVWRELSQGHPPGALSPPPPPQGPLKD